MAEHQPTTGDSQLRKMFLQDLTALERHPSGPGNISTGHDRKFPTNLAALPTELVEKISSTMTPRSFFDFRLSSRKYREASSDTFVQRFFTKKRILWTEHALSALASMTQDPSLLCKIREIAFCGPTGISSLAASEAMLGKDSELDTQQRFMLDHQLFLRREADVAIVASVFQNLAASGVGVGIVFDSCACTWRDDCDLAPAWGLEKFQESAGCRNAFENEDSTPADQQGNLEMMLTIVIDQMARAGTNVTSLKMEESCTARSHKMGVHIPSVFIETHLVSMPGIRECLGRLEMIDFRFDFIEPGLNTTQAGDELMEWFASFLRTCPNLIEIKLDLDMGPEHDEAPLKNQALHGISSLNKLEKITLRNSSCGADDLLELLETHRTSLMEVRLYNITLDRDAWIPLIRNLATFPGMEQISISDARCEDGLLAVPKQFGSQQKSLCGQNSLETS